MLIRVEDEPENRRIKTTIYVERSKWQDNPTQIAQIIKDLTTAIKNVTEAWGVKE